MRLLGLTVIAAATLTLGARRATEPDTAGLKLPAGFSATLFADSLAAPRHLSVRPNGDVAVAIRAGRDRQGGVFVLRDADGDGKAESKSRYGQFDASEAQWMGDWLYTETSSAIIRVRWPAGATEPSGAPDTIVSGLPGTGNHRAKTFVIHDGSLYVNHGSATNTCQEKDRAKEVKGIDPCPELAERAGIWRFSATKSGQTLKDGERFAAGIRNAVALAIEPRSGALYAMQHGRDQLDNFPPFTVEKNTIAPAEEMLRVNRGDDFGWPYCYFDLQEGKKVLAPEYGGDGKTVGRCADKKGHVAAFPAHWAPDGLLFYTGNALPARYRNGAFIVFHGSWNRAPVQEGFRVVFQPMSNGRANGDFETFVDGFMGPDGKPTELGGRPMGIAQGPKGELYLSDDSRGRIWKIQYTGK